MYCPLCKSNGPFRQNTDALKRTLIFCPVCHLVFASREFLPDQKTEKIRYLEHNNAIDNREYLAWLKSLVNASLRHFSPNMRILDFGCGPVKALAKVLREENYHCFSFDPIFYPLLPEGKFDAIIAIETAEHFFNPGNEFHKMITLLNNKGFLFIATYTWDENTDFTRWHYARDFTHVSFYHQNTMIWIESFYGLELIETWEKRTFLFRKLN